MTSLEQWRSSIGVFSNTHVPLIRISWNDVTEETLSTNNWYAIATIRLLLCSNSLLFITAMLLMCSGDVEMNSGPVTCKKCPVCQLDTVPIKLKNALVGTFSIRNVIGSHPNVTHFLMPLLNQHFLRDSDLLSFSCVQTPSQPVRKPTTEGNDTVMTGVTDNNNKTTSYTTQAQSQPVMKSATEGNDTVMTDVSDNHNTTSHTAQA